jgi:hypothetical protein
MERAPAWQPTKFPNCPSCGKPMQLKAIEPDALHANLRHVVYMCDCGRTIDQLVAIAN